MVIAFDHGCWLGTFRFVKIKNFDNQSSGTIGGIWEIYFVFINL